MLSEMNVRMRPVSTWRNCIAAIAIVLWATACQEKGPKFQVSGTMAHLPKGTKLSLKQIGIGFRGPLVIDTCRLGANGTFLLKTLLPIKGSIVIVHVDAFADFFLVTDTRAVVLTVDAFDIGDYRVVGSSASSEMKAFLEDYAKAAMDLDSAISTFKEKWYGKDNDSIVWQAGLKKQNAASMLAKVVEKHLAATEEPALKAFFLAKGFGSLDQSKLVSHLASLKSSPGLDRAVAILEQAWKDSSAKAESLVYPFVAKNCPSLNLPDTSGKRFSPDSFRGKTVLLDFWTSWNDASRRQLQQESSLRRRYKGLGFEVLGISLDSNWKRWKRTIVNEDIPWPNVIDIRGHKGGLLQRFKFDTIPANVLLDTSGHVIAADIYGRELSQKLYGLMEGKAR